MAQISQSSPTPTPTFDPDQGAVLPTHRIIAFYAVPYAEPTGPAYEPTDSMLDALKQQGAAYEQIDPAHPVQLGIDLLLFLDLNFGQSPIIHKILFMRVLRLKRYAFKMLTFSEEELSTSSKVSSRFHAQQNCQLSERICQVATTPVHFDV
jgi:hypothetical protein